MSVSIQAGSLVENRAAWPLYEPFEKIMSVPVVAAANSMIVLMVTSPGGTDPVTPTWLTPQVDGVDMTLGFYNFGGSTSSFCYYFPSPTTGTKAVKIRTTTNAGGAGNVFLMTGMVLEGVNLAAPFGTPGRTASESGPANPMVTSYTLGVGGMALIFHSVYAGSGSINLVGDPAATDFFTPYYIFGTNYQTLHAHKEAGTSTTMSWNSAVTGAQARQYVIPVAAAAVTAPTITVQPNAQTVTSPTAATFSVTATGSGLSYQWQRNTGNIGGATSASYTTPATTVSGGSANSGDAYRCVVTNGGGSVTSTSAVLTVNPGPATALTVSGPSSGQVGVASGTITVAANGSLAASKTVAGSDGAGGAVTFAGGTTLVSGGSVTCTYTPSSAGAKTVTFTASDASLTAATLAYTASAVAGRLLFTAAPADVCRALGSGAVLASASATVHIHDATTGSLVAQISKSTDSGGLFGTVSHGAIAVSTSYRLDFKFASGEYGVVYRTSEAA